MKIPKKIQKIIDKREKLALDLIKETRALDAWLEKNGADFLDPDLADSTLSGCMIYCEPVSAKISVENYVKNKL